MNVPSELVVVVELDPEHPEPSVTSTHTFALWTYPERITTPLNETEITESFEKQKNNMQELKDIYVELFNKNWFEKGAYFQGTWIEGDVQLCGPIVESLPNIK